MLKNSLESKKTLKENLFEYWNIQGINPAEPYQAGFVMVPNIVFRYLNRLGIGGTQASLGLLFLYMRSRDFQKSGNIFPGHSLIAEDTGTTVNTIERQLKKLRKNVGLIESERRYQGNIQKSNIYTWNGFDQKLRELLIKDGLIIE